MKRTTSLLKKELWLSLNMEAFLNSLERKFGRFAIQGLTTKLLILKGMMVLVALGRPAILDDLVNYRLVPTKPLTDLVVLVCFPPQTIGGGFDIIWVFFAFYILFLCGKSLEQLWGNFRFNLFVFSYVVLTFCFVQVLSVNPVVYAQDLIYLNCFLAFAIFFPNIEFLIFFVLPVKVKWLGWVSVALYTLSNIMRDGLTFFDRAFAVIAVLNVIVIFLYRYFYAAKNAQRVREFQKKVEVPKSKSFHVCAECGITDLDDPEMEFRVSAEDGKDYCINHIK